MDSDDDFEDLLAGSELLPESSQSSVLDAPADRLFTQHFNRAAEDAMPMPMTRPAARLPMLHANCGIIDKVEAVFEALTDAMLNEQSEISITLKVRRLTATSTRRNANLEPPTKKISFPGRSADEAWRFAVVLRIMGLIHEALRNDVLMSKRDLYYRDPALFGSQSPVDRYVDDIAHSFGVSRSALNITAVAKGLVTGALTFHRRDGSSVNITNERKGFLVPNLKDILSIDLSAARWILVIEKEASFQSITSSEAWNTISSFGIIITGKGYPDLSTRILLRSLTCPSVVNGFASPPVYGLADFDPDGIAILSMYTHGSVSLAHELKEHCLPQMQRLGLHSEHLHVADANPHAAQGLLTLTVRDRKKALRMLDQVTASSSYDQVLTARELQRMLILNCKAELQILDSIPNAMMNLLASGLDGMSILSTSNTVGVKT